MAQKWTVTVYELDAVMFTHVYSDRYKAAACVMRWNKGRKQRLERGDTPRYFARMEKTTERER